MTAEELQMTERASTIYWHAQGVLDGTVERLREQLTVLRATYSDLCAFIHREMSVDPDDYAGECVESYGTLYHDLNRLEERLSECIDLVVATCEAYDEDE